MAPSPKWRGSSVQCLSHISQYDSEHKHSLWILIPVSGFFWWELTESRPGSMQMQIRILKYFLNTWASGSLVIEFTLRRLKLAQGPFEAHLHVTAGLVPMVRIHCWCFLEKRERTLLSWFLILLQEELHLTSQKWMWSFSFFLLDQKWAILCLPGTIWVTST